MNELNGQTYSFENFNLDPVNRQLRRDGEPVQLPAKAFDILHALIENKGRLVEKDELFERVWRGQIVEESNLTVYISQIRKVLGETKKSSRLIETVPGYGYRFVGEVAGPNGDDILIETETLTRITIEHEAENGFVMPAATNGVSPRAIEGVRESPGGRARYLIPVIALLLIAAGAGLFVWLWKPFEADRTNASVSPFGDAKINQLTTKGLVGWSAISPDGKFFAYALNERGEFKQSLWLAQTDGGGELQLRPAGGRYRTIEFSPDGKMLYFLLSDAEDAPGGFFRMPVLGGPPEKLPIEVTFRFSISPDGKEIAFARRDAQSGDSTIVIADLSGSGERVLLSRPASLPVSSWKLAWSPDGTQLAFAAVADEIKRSSEFFVVNVSDGEARQVTDQAWLAVHSIVWTSDRTGLIAVARSRERTERQLWHVELASGRLREVTPETETNGSSLSISADSRSLMTVYVRRESNIWIAPADDLAQARQITFSSLNGIYGWNGIDWSADGRIVFVGEVNDGLVLYSMNEAGGDVRQITSPGYIDRHPRALPDGKTIVFQSNRSGAWEIWSVRSDGGSLRQLTFDGGNEPPIPTPDGKWIVYASDRSGKTTLWQMSTDGSGSAQITDKESTGAGVSPDGELLACEYRTDINQPVRLAILRIEDGTLVKTFDVPISANFNGGTRFTPDGKAVTYRDTSNGLWKQNLDGGPPTRLEGLPEEKLYMYTWSPDGKLFAFARGREISDVVLLTEPVN